MKKYRPHLLVLCVLALVSLTGMHNALQNAITDLRFGWFPRQASGNVVLVAIDSPSLEKIGVWPWPRTLHAELIGRLESVGATDIVFDVDFSSPSNASSDQAFADALEKAAGSVVLPAFQQLAGNSDHRKTVYVSRPLPQFGKQAWSALVNVAVEPDGLVRRYSYGERLEGGFLPSVGALLAGKYNTKEKPFQIDFSIDADSLPTVSYIDVLRGDAAALKKIKGNKVVIGATAVELGDRFNVPNKGVIVGPILQILAIDKSFVRKLQSDSDDMAIVGATIGLGKLLGLSVIAEGIEDGVTADLLRSKGCEEGQGYYFGRPMPAWEFEKAFFSSGASPNSKRLAAAPAASAA